MKTLPPSGEMMTKLREHFGGHQAFAQALRDWRAAHPIPGTQQWPPVMHAVADMYRHFLLRARRSPKLALAA